MNLCLFSLRERVLEAVGAFVRSFAGVLALASKSLYTYTYLYNLITFQVVVIFFLFIGMIAVLFVTPANFASW